MYWFKQRVRRVRWLTGWVALLLVLVLLANGQASSQSVAAPLTIWRVSITDNADVQRLFDSGFDVLEARGDGYVLVLGDAAAERELRSASWKIEVHETVDTLPDLFTYYGGYHTVAEHYAHLDSVAATYPNLVQLVNYGVSWQKLANDQNGFNLRAICITNQQPGDCALNPQSSKPRLMIQAAIHARELTTSELAWRWIDELVTKYGSDPEITELLNHNEMWVIPVVNPDGRTVVEQGNNSPYSQRKNTHDYSSGACSTPPNIGGSQAGVDLNRNANYQWGGASTSNSPCSLVYRGPIAASEPETYMLQDFLAQIFPDQRADDINSSAPISTTGTFITLHTYSNLVLFPWGWTECNGFACPASLRAPNDVGLRSLGFRLSYFNQYDTGQPSELLYAAAGGTDDWTYGRLGIASYTFEVGPDDFTNCSGFFPLYSCQDSRFWPENRGAFLYAGWTARQPYALSLGPTAFQVTTAVTEVNAGEPLALTAMIDDNRFGNNGVNRPAAQPINQAEVWIDTPPWEPGTPVALTATDGSFNSTSEAVTAQLDTTGLALGRHTLWVRGRDSAGNWGPAAPQWFWVAEAPAANPQIFIPLITQ